MAIGSLPLSPSGTEASRTTVKEITPGTERSIPPCWMTSVWPTATIARIAANGSMPSSELWLRLCGSTNHETTNRMTVAATIPVAAPADRPTRSVTRRSVAVAAAAWGADAAAAGVAGVATEPGVGPEASRLMGSGSLLLRGPPAAALGTPPARALPTAFHPYYTPFATVKFHQTRTTGSRSAWRVSEHGDGHSRPRA